MVVARCPPSQAGRRPCRVPAAGRLPNQEGAVILTLPPHHTPRRRTSVAALAATFAVLPFAPAAHAADVLVLDSETVTLSGAQTFGFVYVDGDLRLTGDTSIKAASIYFGPNSSLRTCYVEGTGNDGCTNGRALTLQSTGPLTVSSGIDLTGGTGAPQNGGTLVLQGSPVAVGGDINTSGSGGGASGAVTIASGGTVSAGSIYAYGAPVSVTATGSIDVGGDIQAQGTNAIAQPDQFRVAAAGPVTVASSAGDARIGGNINASGRDAPANAGAGLGGGVGVGVELTGTNVRVGSIDATGGTSADSGAGPSGPINLTARGALTVLGRLDAGGQNSTSGGATPGAAISATAAGRLVVAGGAWTSGAVGPTGATPGGTISLQGGTVDAGTLYTPGANGPSTPAPLAGAPGGAVTVTATGDVSISQIQAYGGNGPAGSTPGRGAPVSVTSSSGSIASGRISTRGGFPNNGPGADGGAVALSAQTDLTVGGSLDASGSNASGDADPPRAGGNAGNVLLRAATGTLALGDNVDAAGGYGAGHPVNGKAGGAGGRGGRIDVVAHAIGAVVAISTHGGGGGDFGDDQGPGGAGGPIYAWTEAPLFDDQKVVDTDGGSGHPVGASGAKVKETMPTAVAVDAATGQLSFTSRSPDATAYRVLRSVAGADATQVLETTKTSGLTPDAPICTPVTFTVIAVNGPLGWASDAPAAATYLRPPSASQLCGDPPTLEALARLRYSKRTLRKAKWKLTLKLRSSGIGQADISLVGRRKVGRRSRPVVVAKLSAALTKPGDQALRLSLPVAARKLGRYTLRVVTTAPDGKTQTTNTLKLEVRR